MFLDTSRGRRRRWCRMGVCGNVSKVRRFRDRQRGAS
jgi:predicted RNA-binding Zn ribbon-like protein